MFEETVGINKTVTDHTLNVKAEWFVLSFANMVHARLVF